LDFRFRKFSQAQRRIGVVVFETDFEGPTEPNLMRLALLFPTQSVLQLILRNTIEMPYEFGRENAAKKSTCCCQSGKEQFRKGQNSTAFKLETTV
jgi:hypothetical protein